MIATPPPVPIIAVPEPHPYLRRPILYISGLPSGITDDEITLAFKPCASFRLRIIRDFLKELWGSIEFECLDQAEKALACFHDKPFPGLDPPAKIVLSLYPPTLSPPIRLPPASATPRIVKFLPAHYTDFQLYDLFRPYGALATVRRRVPSARETAIIEFWWEYDARGAEDAMRGIQVDGRDIVIQSYQPLIDGSVDDPSFDPSQFPGSGNSGYNQESSSANVPPQQRPGSEFTVEDAATTCDSHFTSAATSKFAFGPPDLALESAAWRRLCSRTFLPHEVIYLIEGIFTNKDEVKMICDLRGDDAQTFVDVIHKALHLPDLPARLWGKCLSALCRICSRQAVLPKSLQIPICYNRLGTPLYRGGFADVWKGEYQGCEVAVKVLRIYSTSDIAKVTGRFCKEVITWNSLRHPNVLPLWGIITDKDQLAMVSEWMRNGNINEFIRAHTEVNRFELLRDVTLGLMYIHSQTMIHGDLKGANILVDQNRRARLADFGLLTIVSDPTYFTASSSASTGGTVRWMSPEILEPEQFGLDHGRPTRESDCYALGMVIYEVLSGQVPFASSKEYIVTQKVLRGERPGRPGGGVGAWFTDELWNLLGLCWEAQAQNRPGIEDLLESLERASGTWKPLPPVENHSVGKAESEWDLTADMLLTKLTLNDFSLPPHERQPPSEREGCAKVKLV